MSFLEQNLVLLAARHPRTAEALAAPAAAGESTALRVQDTTSGWPTATVDGVHLYGRHDPVRDADAQVRREIDPDCTAIIAIGFGLGYGAEAARLRFPSLPLLVVEPDAESFRTALSCRDLRRLFADPEVHLHVKAPAEALPQVLETLPLARPAFLRLRPVLRARPATYRASEETIQSWLLRRDINVNTLNRFGRLWVRNLCRNLAELVRCPGVASLHGLFDGLPALVVAGGPSLDDVAPRLAQLRERMLILSVNTSLRACMERGVEPDFTVVVDPQYWASRSLDWTLARNGVFVAEPSTCPRVFRREGERFFLCSSLFPLGETLEAALGEKGRLGAGGSVSTSAWDLARLLGARPLYAAGLDLGFPGMRTHCRGAYTEGIWLAAADRLLPLETNAFRALRDIGLFSARSAAGGATATDRRMLLYKWWFENQLRVRPGLGSFTLSPHSVSIEGMPLVPLEDALSLPRVRPEIDERMETVRLIHETGKGRKSAEYREGRDEKRDTLRDAVGQLQEQLAELETLSKRGEAGSRELARQLESRGDTAACVKDMDTIDQGILAVSARGIAGFLIQSVIHGITGVGGKEASPREVAARSEAIYAGIAESAAWQRLLLHRAAAELAEGPGNAGSAS